MTALAAPEPLTVARALEIVRDLTKDDSWQVLPLGHEIVRYLRIKRKRLTRRSLETWELRLRRLAIYFPASKLEDFELPAGGELIEQFLADQWGDAQPSTYNTALSIIKDFFQFQVKHGRMVSNPASVVDKAKTREVERNTFSEDDVHAIIANAASRRDRLALRLLLDYGLRRGELLALQVKHADYSRRKLTIHGKGGTVRLAAIPHAAWWTDWERWVLESEAQPDHFLMCSGKGNQWDWQPIPTEPMSVRMVWAWWGERLRDAGVAYLKMHAARHTAGQRMLDATGNLKAVQMLLRHASITTTADVYVDWDTEQVAVDLLRYIPDEY